MEFKQIYDDGFWESAIHGSYMTKRSSARIDASNRTYANVAYASCKGAVRMVSEVDKNRDPEVALAICFALVNSIIIYGKTGEKFIREKLAQCGIEFSQETYTKFIAQRMIHEYSKLENEQRMKRTQNFYVALDKAFRDSPDCVEANAAKTAIISVIYLWKGKYIASDKTKKRFLDGEVIGIEEVWEILHNWIYGELVGDEWEKLEIVYNYTKLHSDKIHADFRRYFSADTEEELIAYDMANDDIYDLEYVMKKALSEQA